MQPPLSHLRRKPSALRLVSTALCIWGHRLDEVETLGAPRSEIDSVSLHFQLLSTMQIILLDTILFAATKYGDLSTNQIPRLGPCGRFH